LINFKLNNHLTIALHILIGTLVSCLLGWYNEYPIVYSDLGTYLKYGFLTEVPIDRPLTYGWFLRHTSLAESLFFSMLAQALLMVVVLYIWVQAFFTRAKVRWYYVSLTVLSLCTSFSFEVAQLLPDAFTPIVFLSSTVLLMKPISKLNQWTLGIILVFSIATHSAHFLLAFAIIAGAVGLRWFKYDIHWGRIRQAFLITCIGSLVIPTTSLILDDGFYLNKGSSVFLFEKLCDLGIAEDHLRNTCDKTHHSLCPYVNELNGDFLWDRKSPLYKIGGWDGARGELDQLNREMLSISEYRNNFIQSSVNSGFRQLLTWEIEEPTMHEAPIYPIEEYLRPNEVDMYLSARQSTGNLSLTGFNAFLNAVIYISLSLLVIGIILFPQIRPILITLLTFLAANAFVCAMFSAVIHRYQCRVIWLVPLLAILVIENLISRFPARTTQA